MITDPFENKQKAVYTAPFEMQYTVGPGAGDTLDITIRYQGCSRETCFFPQTETFTFERSISAATGDASTAQQGAAANVPLDDDVPAPLWQDLLKRFQVTGTAGGYMDAEALLAFLDSVEDADHRASGADGASRFEEMGLLPAILLILLGGLALNLTPCVLPMIPINIAIIGAGAQAGSRLRGFLLGMTYGAGIAVAYGALGLAVVLTGSRFGALNASPWFNAGITVLFVLLALGMFDVFHIDFSRLQGKVSTPGAGRRGTVGLAFFMGLIAALLAGACVAPVVISVLVWAGSLYARGVPMGLLLPFVLGVGMALPWPFAGAGLSFLPKPGTWMTVVRNAFGVLILLLALYYGHLAWTGFMNRASALEAYAGTGPAVGSRAQNQHLARELEKALEYGQPVLIDFTASWCKNCQAMKKTTFPREAVKQHLKKYIFIEYVAENPADPNTKEVLDALNVIGLPTMLVLEPEI
jgi:thiol:disulfide interchange protein